MLKNGFIFIVLITSLLLILLVGCRTGVDNSFAPPEYVYLPEIIPFPTCPDGLEVIDKVAVTDDLVFFSAMFFGDVHGVIRTDLLFSMEIDGTNPELLPNYRPNRPKRTFSSGTISISSMHIDSGGNLWVVESGYFILFGSYANIAENEDIPSIPVLDSFGTCIIRKLDNCGEELMSIDISDILTFDDRGFVFEFCIDGAGNLYISSGNTIYILDTSGTLLFHLSVQGNDNRLIRLSDGAVAHFGRVNQQQVLQPIDVESKTWSEQIALPPINIKSVIAGNDDFTAMLIDGTSLFGISAETGESIHILNWIDSGLIPDRIKLLRSLPDGRLLAVSQPLFATSYRSVTDLVFLTKTPYRELEERSLLTLATFRFEGDLQTAVLLFNRTSTTHRIQVVDYSIFNTGDDPTAGLIKLYTEIIAGRVPDILDMTNLPFEIYAARGLLVDLNPFLDNDPKIERNDLIDGVLRAAEIDGALYRISPNFSVSTIIGNPNVVGNYPGWNIADFRTVLDANPQADLPLGTNFSSESFLKSMLEHNLEQFVDWDEGSATFDSRSFIDLLELAAVFPAQQYAFESTMIEEHEMIKSGRQIMMHLDFRNFRNFTINRSQLGGNVEFKGFPAESGNSNKFSLHDSVAITVGCKDKEGAWEFLRTFLTEEFYREIFIWRFPVNRTVFQELLAEAMDPEFMIEFSFGFVGDFILIEEVSQNEADRIIALIESISGTVELDEVLWNVINENASEYFRGLRTAQDAARIIQSRASRYLSELS